jgi:hypothetical protein
VRERGGDPTVHPRRRVLAGMALIVATGVAMAPSR